MKRGSILSFARGSWLAMSLSRSVAGRHAPASSGSSSRSKKENFVGNARSTAGADDLSGSDAEPSKAHASAMSFSAGNARPVLAATASPVREAAWLKERAVSLRRARTRVFDRSQSATPRRANQAPEPTRLSGAVLPTRLLRSTALRSAKCRVYARQRVAQL